MKVVAPFCLVTDDEGSAASGPQSPTAARKLAIALAETTPGRKFYILRSTDYALAEVSEVCVSAAGKSEEEAPWDMAADFPSTAGLIKGGC